MGLFSFETFHFETFSFEFPRFEVSSFLYFAPPPTRTLSIAFYWFAQATGRPVEDAKASEADDNSSRSESEVVPPVEEAKAAEPAVVLRFGEADCDVLGRKSDIFMFGIDGDDDRSRSTPVDSGSDDNFWDKPPTVALFRGG